VSFILKPKRPAATYVEQKHTGICNPNHHQQHHHHQSSPIIINHHQSSSIIINHHQSTSIITHDSNLQTNCLGSVETPTFRKAFRLCASPLHSAHPQYVQNPMQVEQEVVPLP